MNAYDTKQGVGKTGEAYQLLRSGDGSLMLKKLRELFPVMLLNRISIMVMLSVDSVVVGWGIGEKAVASVNYLQPFSTVIGALVLLVSNGVATLMSKQLGANDSRGIERSKKAILYSTLLLSVVLSVFQIPVCLILFRLYGMDDAVYDMALRYAYAVMLVTPFSIMNTIGTYLLTSIGRVKAILHVSLLQSGVNVALDVIFVFGFGMSTDGAGFGTLGAGIAYWVYILIHLLKHSEFLKIDRKAECRREMLDILKYGAPSLISALADAIFGAAFFWFISRRLYDTGVVIHSVCLFAASFVTMIYYSLRSAMQSLTGMLSTIGDVEGMHRLLKQAMTLCLGLCGGIALIAEFFPSLFFRAYGYREIPDIGIMVLRIFALHFLLVGINGLLQLYFNCWDDAKFASIHSSLSSFVLPAAFATVFFLFGAPWTLWLCYGLADAICFAIAWRRYLRKYRSERAHTAPNEFNVITHPDEAPHAAAQLEHVLLENGISHTLANRVALCVEEIGAYAVPVRENAQVTIQIYACVSEEETTIFMLDDGQCVVFPKNNQENVLATDNYEMLKRITSECAYDYILDLNRFTMKLDSKKSGRMI